MAEQEEKPLSPTRKPSMSKLLSFSSAGSDAFLQKEASKKVGGGGAEEEGFSRFVQIGKDEEDEKGLGSSRGDGANSKKKKRKTKSTKYASNWVSTTKYNVVTFLPKSLFEQFRRMANLYFLFTAILSVTPLSPFSAASLISPLVFVVGVSMAKEAIEDWQRFLQDKEVNDRKVLVHQGDGKFRPTAWRKVSVGDIVKVEKDQFFPADLFLISSSFEDGICYVETMNLDGETNLKLKRSLDCTVNLELDEHFRRFHGRIVCENPNPLLYSFVGKIAIDDLELSLGPNQLLLRDSKLRNTDHVYGAVVFSGHDTKVMQNATPPPSKRSDIEKRVDLIIAYLFAALFLMSAVGSVVFGFITEMDTPHWWYLRPDDTTSYYDPDQPLVAAFLHLITALILYGYLIPISLYVSIEVVKVAQAMFINQDVKMYYEDTDTPARARTSNLNEELGQVGTILSDKTGTLTCNQMDFVKCSIAGNTYGEGVTEVEIAVAKRQGKRLEMEAEEEDVDMEEAEKPHIKGFNFKDSRLMEDQWIHERNAAQIQLFLRILAVCHTVVPEEDKDTGRITYEAESPDEAAFVIAARELGFEFTKRTLSSVSVQELDATSGGRVTRVYKILDVLEFNSNRKRMSVVVKDEEENIFLFSKGADSVIFERLGNHGRGYEEATRSHLASYADAGLRTLALAYRKIDASEYELWSREFFKAKTYVGADRDIKLDEVSELIERDLMLVGATGVEDKLQKGVPHCIDKLAQAGIKIWVLTGDKMETAINIGFACSLLRQDMSQLAISLDNNEIKNVEASGDKELIAKACRDSVKRQISSSKQQIEDEEDSDAAFALIIDGKALNFALEKDLESEMMGLATKCASVICCRVSPKQKATITKLVKRSTGGITLAIGDGANDVGMIQEAHIGVGISGVEGMQATMASDFAIAQFCYLEQLLLVHGSWCYKRIAHMICYFFYKNIHFGFTLFYYEAYAAFSAQAAYNDWYMTLFNVFFTSLPVIALGVLEQDVAAHLKLQFPHLYQQGIKNWHFSWKRILGYMADGILSSIIVFYFTLAFLEVQAYRGDGQVPDLELLGATWYTGVVWIVNCQLALFTKYFTWIQHACIWGSILLWYLYLVIYGYFPATVATTAFRVFIEACAPAPSYWLITLLVTIAALFPAFIYKSFQSTFFPNDDQIIQELSYMQKDRDRTWLARVMANTTLHVTVGITARLRQLQHRRHDKKISKDPQYQHGDTSGIVDPLRRALLDP